MAGYTRQSTFADGDTITAALFNNEYNQLVNAFSNTSGHAHDGTAANGPVIGLIGDAGEVTPLNKVLIDTVNNYIEFYVDVSSSSVQQLYIADGAIVPVTDNDIDLGTSSLEFKDLYLDGTATIDTLTVDEAATIGTTLGVTGATTLSSTLGVTGATTLSSTLGVTGAATLSSTLAVTGTSTLTGNVTASNDLSVGGNLTVTGNATISGNLTFGDADTDSITLTADVASNIVPDTDDTYDLGTATKQWRNLYIDGTAEVDTLSIDGTAVTSTAAELNILDGVTATAAEINTLDGITATVAELNILDGVTSTATELNIMDGDTAATATTLADADRVVVNDAGTMKQVALTDFETYFEGALDTLSNVTTVGALNAGSITSGFGAIDNGSSNITTTGTVTYGSLSDGTITITAFADEDDMVSNSATLVPTQQSVKAYVDAQVATANELSELTDVNLTTPADASLLFYDTLTSKWIDNVVSGDITIADTGVAAISSGVIVNDDINASAAISVSKTALTAGTGLTLSTDTLSVDAAQTQITSVGTLSSLTVSGDLTVDTDTFYVDSTNNRIGIGTTSPNASSVHVDGGGQNSALFLYSNDTDTFITISDDDGAAEIRTKDGGALQFSTGGTTNTLADSTTAMYINSSQNVGIGTTSPSTSLHVRKDQNSSGNTLIIQNEDSGASAAAVLTMDAQGNSFNLITYGDGTSSANVTEFKSVTGSSEFAFSPSSTEKMRIDSSGNVGIGNTSPQRRLTVGDGSGSETLSIYAGTGSASGLHFTDTNTATDYQGFITYDHSTDGLRFGAAEAEGMRLTSTGLGIGTASPDQLLHISASANPAIRIENTDTTATSGQTIGKIEFEGQDASTNAAGVRALIDAQYAGVGGQGRLKFQLAQENSASLSDSLLLNYGAQQFFTNGSERMRIDSSGNVLVGKTSSDNGATVGIEMTATDKLYVTDSASSPLIVNRLSSDGNVIAIQKDGTSVGVIGTQNWGIGTTSPSTNLHLVASSPQIRLQHSGNSFFSRIITDSGNNLILGTGSNGTERMRIDSSGNVGIGTSSPSQTLDVVGTFEVDHGNYSGNDVVNVSTDQFDAGASFATGEFLLFGDHNGIKDKMLSLKKAGTDVFMVDSGGLVGVGTSDPQSKFELREDSTGFGELRLTNARYNTNSVGSAISARGYQNVEAGRIEFLRVNTWNEGAASKDSAMVFSTTNNGTSAETMRITADNLLQVGTTTTSDGRINATTLSGKYALALNDTFGNNALAQFLDNGSQVGSITISGSNTSYNTSSDSRLKENIVDANSQLETINNIKIREFDWLKDGKHEVGVIAQELEEVYPDAVTVGGEDVNKNPYSVDYSKLVAPLIKAVQEQQEQIESLKSEIELLKGGN